jgi:hypothetical protein
MATPLVRAALLAIIVVFSVGCAFRDYQPQPEVLTALQARAQSQSVGGVEVSAAVPGAEETERLFGLALYERGIQPVWLEIRNRGDDLVRFTPTSLDRDYFSPIEVAYVHRKGYTKEGRREMERHFHEQGMARFVPAGEARAGFVFTNLQPGTKAFNVDVFGNAGGDHRFTFFITVPGFAPDHTEIDFHKLYRPEEVRSVDEAGLRASIAQLPCCSMDASGERMGEPFNVVFVGHGQSVRYALLRAEWLETERKPESRSQLHHYRGRPPDATFRKRHPGGGTRDELRVWLTPLLLGDKTVWLGQVSHNLAATGRGRHLIPDTDDDTTDPDMDEARRYLLQNFWYAQALAKYGHVSNHESTWFGEQRTGFNGVEYFTDGHIAVLWIADEPISLLDVEHAGWDPPPPPRLRATPDG